MQHLQAFKDVLDRSSRIVIIPHNKPDADALGSSLGLCNFLRGAGKQARVISPSDYPAFLNWMPGNDDVLIFEKNTAEEVHTSIATADMIFCMDFSVLSRIYEMGDMVRASSATKVLIDHHLEPERFADFEQWSTDQASTSGLVYDLLCEMDVRSAITPDVASCLYAGLLTDTGGFRHSNTRREEFLIAADLVELGANPSVIARQIYDTNTVERLRLTGYVLSQKLVVLPEYHTAYITLTPEELKSFGSQTGDTEGFVNYGLSINGIKFAALIYERKNEVKLSFRSLGNFSVNEFARKHFNGGGHRNAAGGLSDLGLEQTVKKFIDLLPEYKEALAST